ncbi:MAG TPA: patatin-like phospholipase family protein, partial [Acidimicrobiales bacterium]|nr:patatin-like phospholipase family protein [Acidimicrobiales bacterium]
FVTAARTPMDAARRGAGSAFVMSRSVLRLPLPALPAPLRRAFPGGMFSMLEGQRRFESELPEMWPAQDTGLCTVDIVSGRRIVLGRPRPPHMSLARAVMASCAIPGAYPPVRYGRRELIDGGAHSSTNLDVASRYGCDLIVAIVPMGYDQTDPPGCVGRVTRRLANGSLASEVARVSRRGTRVVTVSPSAAEARLHGVNLMRSHGLLAVAEAAYESTARRLTEERATESGLFAAPAPVGQGWGSSPATTL